MRGNRHRRDDGSNWPPLHLHHHALGCGGLDDGLRLLEEELVEGLPDPRRVDIVMGEDDPARAHPGIEELQAVLRGPVGVHVKVHEGEPAIADRHPRLREDSPVDKDPGEVPEVLPHRLLGGGELPLVKGPDGIDLVHTGQPLECVKEVEMPVPLGPADDLGRPPPVHPHLGDVPRHLGSPLHRHMDLVGLDVLDQELGLGTDLL